MHPSQSEGQSQSTSKDTLQSRISLLPLLQRGTVMANSTGFAEGINQLITSRNRISRQRIGPANLNIASDRIDGVIARPHICDRPPTGSVGV